VSIDGQEKLKVIAVSDEHNHENSACMMRPASKRTLTDREREVAGTLAAAESFRPK
jgi:hypothetical protein